MPRLYYPPEQEAGTSRGVRRSGGREAAEQAIEKVTKLIPAEVITGYSGLVSAAHLSPRPIVQSIIDIVGFLVCVVTTPIYFNQMAVPGKPKIRHIVLSTIAFPIWAYFTSGSQVIPNQYDPGGALALVLGFSLVGSLIKLNK